MDFNISEYHSNKTKKSFDEVPHLAQIQTSDTHSSQLFSKCASKYLTPSHAECLDQVNVSKTKKHVMPPMRVPRDSISNVIYDDDDISIIESIVDYDVSCLSQNLNSRLEELPEICDDIEDVDKYGGFNNGYVDSNMDSYVASDFQPIICEKSHPVDDTPEGKLEYERFTHSVSEPSMSRHISTLNDLLSNTHINFQTTSSISHHFLSKSIQSCTTTSKKRLSRPPMRVPIRETENDCCENDTDDDNEMILPSFSKFAETEKEDEPLHATSILFQENDCDESFDRKSFLKNIDGYFLSPETKKLFKPGYWKSAKTYPKAGVASSETKHKQTINRDISLNYWEQSSANKSSDEVKDAHLTSELCSNFDCSVKTTQSQNSWLQLTCRTQTKPAKPPMRVPLNLAVNDSDEDDDIPQNVPCKSRTPQKIAEYLLDIEDVNVNNPNITEESTESLLNIPIKSSDTTALEDISSKSKYVLSGNVDCPSLEANRPSTEVCSRSPQISSDPCFHGNMLINRIRVGCKVFIKHELLGKGGFSKVYRGSSDDIVDCAIKCVDLVDADESTVSSYMSEVSIMRQLQGFEGIIKLYDNFLDRADKKLYLVMERGEMDLKSFFVNRSKASPEDLPRLIRFCWSQMLRAVNSLHDNGIVHWDLKPANFVIIKGKLKVIDFGISKKVQADHTSVTIAEVMGTYNYMSPEAFNNLSSDPDSSEVKVKVGPKADVWSLGCILYSMVYGAAPFQKITNTIHKILAIASQEIPFPDTPLGPAVVETLKKCLTRETKRRPSVKDLLKDSFLSEW